jgi:glucose-1-phosphate adenylyltransferase
MGKTVAMIMAGGRGKRMDVLCHVRPKPALPFAGTVNVIDFALSNCIYSGIADLAILTDYQRTYMARYLRAWSLSNGVGTLRVLEPVTGSYEGTADAVFQNLQHLDELNAQNVLILAGDHVYKMDYREMIALHGQTGADVTVGVIRIPNEEAHRFGTVSLSDDGEVLEFVEKARNPRSNIASMGIYVFNRDILAQRLAEDAVRPNSPHDFGYAILPDMVGRDKVKAYEFTGYWQDIGTPEAYYAANMELLSRQPLFSLDGTKPVLTSHLNVPPARIADQAVVVNSLVSPGCVIKGYVKDSILSPGVCVDERAEVWNSVVLSNAFIGYHSVADTCIIDEEVNIGKECYVGFGKTLLPGESDITVVGKGGNVRPHAVIRRNSRVLYHVGASTLRSNPVAPSPVLSQYSMVQKACANEEVPRDERESIYVA